MLGVSRGTLRSALQRLEEGGEIVRRQGSGTFVGHTAIPTALDERLERLEPYSSVARRRGLRLSCVDLKIEHRAVGGEAGEALGLAPNAHTLAVSRTLRGRRLAGRGDVRRGASGARAAGRGASCARALEDGKMVLDVLVGIGVPVTFARTRVIPTADRPARPAPAGCSACAARTPGAPARGAHLRRTRRARRLLAGSLRSRGARRDGAALARVHPPGARHGGARRRGPAPGGGPARAGAPTMEPERAASTPGAALRGRGAGAIRPPAGPICTAVLSRVGALAAGDRGRHRTPAAPRAATSVTASRGRWRRGAFAERRRHGGGQ